MFKVLGSGERGKDFQRRPTHETDGPESAAAGQPDLDGAGRTSSTWRKKLLSAAEHRGGAVSGILIVTLLWTTEEHKLGGAFV